VGWALADDLGLVEEVGGQDCAGVEYLDADELAAAPLEGDERAGAGRWLSAGRDWGRQVLLAGEVQVGDVGLPVVGDPHSLIAPAWSASSCR
jgi:hypothetical protein